MDNKQTTCVPDQAPKTVVKSDSQKRVERDAHQAYVAKQRIKALRKMLPKRQRERDVREERKAAQNMRGVGPEEQGFAHILGGVASFAACSIAQSVRKMSKKSNKAADSFTALFDTIKTKLEEFSELCKKLVGSIWMIPVVILAHAVISPYFHQPLVVTLSGAFLAKLFGEKVWSFASRYFSPQSESGDSLAGIGGLICTILCTAALPTKNVPHALGELMKRMSSFERSKDGFEAFFRNALKYAEKAANCLLKIFSLPEVKWVGESERLADAFCREVDDFEKLTRGGATDVNVEKCIAMAQRQVEAIGLKTTVRDDRLRVKIERSLSRLTLLLQPYQGAITAARNFRPEPTFLCFYGGSALGKTTMVTKLACTILVMSGLTTFDTALKNLWQKGNTEYWNGYVNQKCLIMDDCFQVKPVKGDSDNEYMNVIRMIGNWAYALNFADLESKGKFYFDTPLVIGTTNCANVANQADVLVTQPEAVVRRIKHPYKIWVNDAYKTAEGRLDYCKIEAEFDANLNELEARADAQPDDYFMAYPWHAWYLTYHDFSQPQESGKRREIADLIAEVVKGIKDTRDSHNKGLDNLNRFLKGLGGTVTEQSGFEEPVGEHLHDPTEVPLASNRFLVDMQPLQTHEIVPDQDVSECSFSEYANSVVFGEEDFSYAVVRTNHVPPQPVHEPYEDVHYDSREYVRMHTRCFVLVADWLRGLQERHPMLFSATTSVIGFCFGYTLVKYALQLARAAFDFCCSIFKSIFGGRGVPRGRPREQSNVRETRGVPSKVFFRNKIVAESGFVDKSHVHNLIYENTHKMILGRHTDDEVVIGQVQFLELNLAMQPRHFSRQMREKVDAGQIGLEDKITFVRAVYGSEISFTVGQYLGFRRAQVEDHDLEFLVFPRGSLLASKKITQYLLTDEKYQQAIKSAAAVRLDVMHEQVRKDTRYQVRQTLTAPSFIYMKEIASVKQNNKDVLCYSMDTEVGMCGAPLTIAENRYYGGKCYLGMHIAGSPGVFQRKGFSSIVTAEMVADARKKLGIFTDKLVEDIAERGVDLTMETEEQAGLSVGGGLIKGSFTYLGKVDKPISLSPDSKLKLSPIGELELFGPNPQRPAHLRPFFNDKGEKVSPMLQGLEAYTTPLDYRQVPNLEAIVSLATKPFREASVSDYKGIFSKEEAVLGVEGLKIKSIARSTSAGYPYVLTTKAGKKDFFGSSGDFSFDSEECKSLFERVDHIVDSAKRGERLAHVFVDFLKDETRPHAKVDAGATRVISGAPLDYVVAFRMYFGAFMASMFRHHTKSGMCPGINPFSEWWQLASRLSTHGDKCFDGDFKRFDSSEQPYIHYAILDFVNRWYDDGEENAQIRAVLWLDLVHSRHLGGDGRDQCHLYQWNKSLPSGHPFTTPVNSLYSLITLTACYCKATGDYVNMWDHVYIATFGDDNIVNVDDATSEVFNQVTVAQHMDEQFGLTYTAGSKGAELKPYTTLDECTFLKRRFVRDDLGAGGWVAPLDPASFLFVSYYYKNHKDLQGEIKHNLENMLGELSLHSVEMWDKYFPTVREILADGGLTTDFDGREAYQQMMKARLDAWF
jgi:hypothetical protein